MDWNFKGLEERPWAEGTGCLAGTTVTEGSRGAEKQAAQVTILSSLALLTRMLSYTSLQAPAQPAGFTQRPVGSLPFPRVGPRPPSRGRPSSGLKVQPMVPIGITGAESRLTREGACLLGPPRAAASVLSGQASSEATGQRPRGRALRSWNEIQVL